MKCSPACRPRTIPRRRSWELLPVTTVRATHFQLARRLGLAAKDLIGDRLRSAIDAGAIVRSPGHAAQYSRRVSNRDDFRGASCW